MAKASKVLPSSLSLRRVPKLYAIADAATLGTAAVADAACAFADLGVGWIQLRVKPASDGELWRIAETVTRRLAGYEVALWIDDRVDCATLLPLRGVHLGQHDLSPATARAQLPQTWIGLSTHDLDQVRRADADPSVNVIAFGPIYRTESKERPDPCVGVETLRSARTATAKPLVAIGGITEETVPAVLETGADAVAVIGALGQRQEQWRRRIPRLLRRAVA